MGSGGAGGCVFGCGGSGGAAGSGGTAGGGACESTAMCANGRECVDVPGEGKRCVKTTPGCDTSFADCAPQQVCASPRGGGVPSCQAGLQP